MNAYLERGRKNLGRWYPTSRSHVLQPTPNVASKLFFCSQGLGIQFINILAELLSRLGAFEFQSIERLVRTWSLSAIFACTIDLSHSTRYRRKDKHVCVRERQVTYVGVNNSFSIENGSR